ncbi:MAG: glycosyltransferase family A protein, partial [Gemmataceae bacterium]
MSGRFAVVVPTYNGVEVVEAALRSLAEQRDAPWDRVTRVVVSDDASSDGTAELAERVWPADHPAELVIRQLATNGGMWRNKNGAIESLAGVADWALILHQDDLAEPGWVRETIRQLDAAGDTVVSVSSDWLTEYPDGRVEGRADHPGQARPFVGRDAIRNTLKVGCWWHISGAAVRVDDFLRSGGFSTGYAYYGDLDYVLRTLERGRQINFLDLPLIR